jgi:predicted nucleic acid-binding protein
VIVVSDASPLISLAVAGYLDVLQSLYGRVIIPEAVYQEVTGGVPRLPGALAIQELQWIVSQPVQNDAMVRALQGELDHGEAEAIALAVELQAGLILIDERRARAIAARMGLNVVGVLGVLVEAKHKALVPLSNRSWTP